MAGEPTPTGPGQFLTPKQREDAKMAAAANFEKLQQAQIERLSELGNMILEILREKRVTISEWDMLSKTVFVKINKLVDGMEVGVLVYGPNEKKDDGKSGTKN